MPNLKHWTWLRPSSLEPSRCPYSPIPPAPPIGWVVTSLYHTGWGGNCINPLKGLACSSMAINCTPPQPIIIIFGKLNQPEKSVSQIFMFATIVFITDITDNFIVLINAWASVMWLLM